MYVSRCTGEHWQNMERKYGVLICREEYYDPMDNKQINRYRIINNDGFYNVWEKGLTYRGLMKTLKEDGDTLRKLAEQGKLAK